MQFFKRLGLCFIYLLLGVFILVVTVIGFFVWLFSGQDLNKFSEKVIKRLIKK